MRPLGIWGGVLTTAKSSIALQFFHEPLTAEDCARFDVQAGDAKGQQYWEALSVLVGLKQWAPLVAKSSAFVQVKSDSVTALQCTAKLASSSPLLNGIGAEIALVLELYDIEEIVTQHVPGKLNEVADKLSRMAQPGASQLLPPQLRDANPLVSHLSRRLNFLLSACGSMLLCPFAFRANNFSNVGSPCFNTECKYQPRRRHKEEEVGRLGAQSIEVHVVKELRVGAELRCSEGERRVSRIASKLGGSARKRRGGYMEFNKE